MYMRRTKFDRSHVYKTTFNSGKLIPVFVDEVLPGDTTRMSVNYFARLATPIKPIMDNIYLDWFFFFVPNRLVWEHWQNFCFEQEDPDDSTDYVIPTVSASSKVANSLVGSLWDYFGLPINTTENLSGINALPFRAVYLIWNEWFRDENLQKSVKIQKGDTNEVLDSSRTSDQPSWVLNSPGTSAYPGYACPPRGKRHDYFTSALPWTQKGPGVSIGLAGTATLIDPSPVSGYFVQQSNNSLGAAQLQKDGGVQSVFTGNGSLTYQGGYDTSIAGHSVNGAGTATVTAQPGSSWLSKSAYADLDSSSIFTINSLRTAFQMQKFYERLARGGSRYTEVLRSFFGVVSPDARLQRPEFLGSFTKMVNVNPIAQTSATNDTSPQGNLSAYGVTASKFHGFTKSFVEHGYIIGFVCARADLTYQQGVNKMWLRSTVYDFYWPTFAHLGEQAIELREIYAQGTEADTTVFGYQERYAEYRYKPSQITGKFRSSVTDGNLDVWHLSQFFSNAPTLNEEFITENPPIKRIIAVQDEPEFLLDIGFRYTTVRPMPMFGTPGLVDHF
uniref:Capsid protein n=1 Tax=Microviridae sp. ctXu97 TaxID=2825000 RepID=A0A8S5V9E9_9VIRU|nr:MAG TPA: capsid protein [Microviridae sp. ctXu97]